ncbi:molybdenum cofactor biosynthesis protein [Paenibacillus contaminans]|uniref:Molybdopterin synthase catalytic subunit n=1 Tax=Paenibacillus contaminans TaxID=450362 RepID=A0A329MR40_9BACL|nr:molybdenum cofactor biosynthesis protein MoaE [Paenibacillus contaminans]RAV22264.1 molybdopterin converting factor [Paenibacillus contaminans]
MPITIHLFAGLADAIGASRVTLELEPQPNGRTLRTGMLKEALARVHPHASDLIAISFIAVNQAYSADDVPISETDEIALIPPVSGGQDTVQDEQERSGSAMELYCLTNAPVSVEEVTSKVLDPNHGAAITFIGTTREITAGVRTVRLEYEAYAPMAIATLKQIGEEIFERWPGTKCAITHRLGVVDIKEISVVIAVSSPHRASCYEASRYAIERLKQIVPIWKKEVWENGSEWKGHQQGPWNPLSADERSADSANGSANINETPLNRESVRKEDSSS